MNSLQLKLSKQVWQSASFCPEIEHFMALNKINNKQRFKVTTCILEAVGNIIAHGRSNLDDIIIILSCHHDRVTIDLLDNSPLAVLSPPKTSPQPDAISGRGLWILHNWMDKVRYQASVQGTHLRLSLLR